MTNKEAAERIYKVLENWHYVSERCENPDGFCACDDHCHIEYYEAEEVARILLHKQGDLEDESI